MKRSCARVLTLHPSDTHTVTDPGLRYRLNLEVLYICTITLNTVEEVSKSEKTTQDNENNIIITLSDSYADCCGENILFSKFQ